MEKNSVNSVIQKLRLIPGYVMTYYIFELLAAFFCIFAGKYVRSNVWGVYFIVLSTAFIWMTVMEWRILVKKDVRINQLLVLANALWLILIEI